MKTVIYLDVLLVVNFLAAYFLLRAVGFVCGAPPGFSRACLGAGLAACSTLILLAPPLPAVLSGLYQAACAGLICRAAFGFCGWRGLARQSLWYFALNVGLAGAVLLALRRGLPLGAQTNNLAVYWAVSPGVLVGAAGAVYLVLRLMLLVFGAPRPADCWQLCLTLEGVSAPPLTALLDTGFLVRDPLSGQAPVLASYASLQGALPPAAARFVEGFFAGDCPAPPPGIPVRLIPCKTAAGLRTLPALGGFAARLSGPGRARRASRVLVVFTDQTLADGSVQALFGPEFYHTTRPAGSPRRPAEQERSAAT